MEDAIVAYIKTLPAKKQSAFELFIKAKMIADEGDDSKGVNLMIDSNITRADLRKMHVGLWDAMFNFSASRVLEKLKVV